MKPLILLLALALGAVAQEPPPKPQPRVVDKKFLAVTALSIGAAGMDIHSTRYCITHNPNCYEGVGILSGTRPSTAKLVAVNVPMQVGINGLGYLLKKKGKRWWWVPQVAYAGLRVGVAIRNYKITH